VTDHQGRSFGTVAGDYDRYRPGYPPEAVAWALGERPLRVADLGAGTGILSRLLHRLGHEVTAVEPDDRMRARLAEASPGVAAVAGTAEEVPLPDGSVDAVVAGQAYHWFDPDRAHPEMARVLRPGGRVVAMWNDCDLDTAWTVRLVELIDGPDAVIHGRDGTDFGGYFGPVERAEFRHDLWTTPDDVLRLTTTRSPYIVATPRGRRELLAAVRTLTGSGELAGRDRFPMPHVTRVYRALSHRKVAA